MVKKIYNYLFIFCLAIAVCLGFNTKSSKAAIIQPDLNNPIDFTQSNYDSLISDYQLFNSFDFSFVDKINVDLHFTSTSPISTSLDPTEVTTTTYSGNCFGNLCYQQQVKLLIVSMYYTYSGGTYRIYYFSNNDTSSKTLNYSTTTCNTVTYVNNTVSTSNRTLYIAYTNNTYYQQIVSTLYTAYENSEDLMLGSGNSVANAITNLESSWGGKLLYNTNTGLTNATTSKTSTCNSTQTTTKQCNNRFISNYSLNYYGINLGSVSFNFPTTYNSGFSKCIINSIGNDINNGYYYSYVLNYDELENSLKKKIWNSLTQINSTPNFEERTITLTANSNYFTSGINVMIYMQLVFKVDINYEYNNLYIKFNSNNDNTLKYIYYGIYDLLVNYSTNNLYTNFALNEKSKIYGNNLIIVSNNKLSNILNYVDYNFNIALITEVLMDQFLSTKETFDCEWYQFMCHVKNFFTVVVYEIPILSDFYILFESVISTVGTVITVFIEYKEVAFIGTITILSLCYHFIKRSVE